MILGILTEGRAHHASNRKIEAWRTELAFIVTVRIKLDHLRLIAGRPQYVLEDFIDLGVSTSTSLVSKAPFVTDAGHYEPVLNGRHLRFIASQPGDGTDSSRDK